MPANFLVIDAARKLNVAFRKMPNQITGFIQPRPKQLVERVGNEGAQETAPGGRIVRTIGIVRARIKIGLQNFVYNVRRLATLERTRSLASFNVAGRLAAA